MILHVKFYTMYLDVSKVSMERSGFDDNLRVLTVPSAPPMRSVSLVSPGARQVTSTLSSSLTLLIFRLTLLEAFSDNWIPLRRPLTDPTRRSKPPNDMLSQSSGTVEREINFCFWRDFDHFSPPIRALDALGNATVSIKLIDWRGAGSASC